MKYILCFFFMSPLFLDGQAIDGSFPFETDNAKKYSLYIPSDYDVSEPHQLMLGLHPLNTNRWDAQSWRDTLITFAEANSLLLVCPDGGLDGKIDDPIDTSFTTTLLDSVSTWYNINQDEKYVMGFSWGGKTTYTYGLSRTSEFKGYIVIGAAVTLSEVNPVIANAKDETFYLIHGSNDAVSTRYTPLLAALENNEACVESRLLQGVGHTIDFLGRNDIMTEAFQWVKNNNCENSSNVSLDTEAMSSPYPNPFTDYITLDPSISANAHIELYNIAGKAIGFSKEGRRVKPEVESGAVIVIQITDNEQTSTFQMMKK